MPIQIVCACGATLTAPDAAAGRKLPCPVCSVGVLVPKAISTVESPPQSLPADSARLTEVRESKGYRERMRIQKEAEDREQAETKAMRAAEERAKAEYERGIAARQKMKTVAQRKNHYQPTLIDKYEEDYKRALAEMDGAVKDKIEQGREMAGLMLFQQQVLKVAEVHAALYVLYSLVYENQAVLQRFGSERLRQIGHEPIAIYDTCRNNPQLAEAERETPGMIDKFVCQELRKLGFHREHWWFKERILMEIEYMIDALKILVEPDFIPFAASEDGQELRPDRYISAEVKISVWRRDGVIPVTKGGSNTERNIQLLCEKCNRKKAAGIQ